MFFQRCAFGQLLVTALVTGLACTPEFDATRQVPERGTLGEEVYRVFCGRLASEELPHDVSGSESNALCDGQDVEAPTERLAAMQAQRSRIVEAVDATAPESLTSPLNRFMQSLIPFYDPPEAALPTQTAALADLLTAIAEDDPALDALERLSQRQGYRPLRHALGVARPALAYPRLRPLTTTVLDATSEGGAAYEEWQNLLRAAALSMATAEADPPSDTPSTLANTRDLLYREDEGFGAGGALFLARRDARGVVLPMARTGGALPTPFVDQDSDGLADVDPLGRFIGRDGLLLDVPSPFSTVFRDGAPRDPIGRAIDGEGLPLFDTFDVNDTMLAGMAREMAPLFGSEDAGEPAILDAAYAMPALVGMAASRSEEVRDGLTVVYDGFDPENAPLLDFVHAAMAMVEDPAMDDLLGVVEVLLTDHEDAIAALADAGFHGRSVAAEHPDVALIRESDLFDDIMEVFARVAGRPGLTEALLRAIADPRTKRLGHVFAEMMRHSDEVMVDAGDINTTFEEEVWTRTVDHDQPESDSNRSLFQQSISIIHDLSGVRLCNKAGAQLGLTVLGTYVKLPLRFDECELLEIDDVAVAYQQAIIGRGRIDIKDAFVSGVLDLAGALPGFSADEVLERESGITGLTTRPTAQAMSRLVFGERNEFMSDLIDAPMTRDGVPVSDVHQAITLQWERRFRFCGDEQVSLTTPCSDAEEISFFEAMTPLLTAFDDFDGRAEGDDLFSALVTASHLHWASAEDPQTQSTDPRGNFFSHQDNVRAYEPIASSVLAECTATDARCSPNFAGRLMSRLHDLLRIADDIEVRPGVDAIDVLAQTTEYLMDPDRNGGLANRRGEFDSPRSSGEGTLPMTPMLLMTDALAATERVWDTAPDRRDAWRSARSEMADHMAGTERRGAEVSFQNVRFVPLVRVLVGFLREQVRRHREAGDLEAWTEEIEADLEDALDSPLGASTIMFLDAVQDDEASTQELSRFANYMMRETDDASEDALLAMADMLQVLEDDTNIVPLLHVLSEALAPGVRERARPNGTIELSDVHAEDSLVDATTLLMRRANEVDEENVLTILLERMVTLPDGADETPLEALLDASAEVYRVEPARGGPLLRSDYESVLANTIEFLQNEHNGLERIIQVVQSRELSE